MCTWVEKVGESPGICILVKRAEGGEGKILIQGGKNSLFQTLLARQSRGCQLTEGERFKPVGKRKVGKKKNSFQSGGLRNFQKEGLCLA